MAVSLDNVQQIVASRAPLAAHPAAELFPLLAGDEYESFKKDIADNGLLEPIWLCEGKILDGRNRYRACSELGVDPKFQNYDGDCPVAFAWSMNGKRRHLTASQRAAIAVEMLPHLEKEAAKRRGARTDLVVNSTQGYGRSAEIAAQEVGVGSSLVSRAKRIKTEDPALFERLKSGDITANAALEQLDNEDDSSISRFPVEQRAEQIRALATEGYLASQIAEEIGLSEPTVRRYANAAGVTLADKAIGRVHKINAHRVIETTVQGLEGTRIAFDTIRGGEWNITAEEAKEWHTSLGKSIKELNWLRNKLGEIASGN